MTKRLILHIGRHKTGTSALQLYLAAHRDAFAREGIVVPTFGCFDEPDADPEDRVAHHRIAQDCQSGAEDALAGWQRRIAEAAETAETVILSSEAFQNLNDLTAIRQLFPGYYVEVVCYLREYLDYAVSAYLQEVKKVGLFCSFHHFERTFSPDLQRFTRQWETFANRCHWRLYDRSRLRGGDVVGDFLHTAGLPDFGGERHAATNPRIGGSLLGFKLMANGAGLHSRSLARRVTDIAADHSDYRLPLRIGVPEQARLRDRRPYNRFLAGIFGEITVPDLSTGRTPFESPSLDRDFADILGRMDDIAAVRTHPLFAPYRGRGR